MKATKTEMKLKKKNGIVIETHLDKRANLLQNTDVNLRLSNFFFSLNELMVHWYFHVLNHTISKFHSI